MGPRTFTVSPRSPKKRENVLLLLICTVRVFTIRCCSFVIANAYAQRITLLRRKPEILRAKNRSSHIRDCGGRTHGFLLVKERLNPFGEKRKETQ
jgi:hypothetical protein